MTDLTCYALKQANASPPPNASPHQGGPDATLRRPIVPALHRTHRDRPLPRNVFELTIRKGGAQFSAHETNCSFLEVVKGNVPPRRCKRDLRSETCTCRSTRISPTTGSLTEHSCRQPPLFGLRNYSPYARASASVKISIPGIITPEKSPSRQGDPKHPSK